MATFGTWSSGDVLTAANLNTGLPACLLTSASQTIPTGTFTKLLFSSEVYDPLGWHSTSTSTERITPTIAGVYLINASVGDVVSGINGRLFLGIYKNGSTSVTRFDITSTLLVGCSTSTTVYMNGTSDYLDVTAYQTNGTSRDFQVLTFSAVRVAG